MKYYLYISDQKVDMLLPQVPMRLRQTVSAELGLDIGVLSARVKSERTALDDRVSRLSALEKALRTKDIGSLDSPRPWIADTVMATLSCFAENKRLAFFIGRSPQSNFVLGGSAAHLVSGSADADVSAGWSYMPHLLETLEQTISRGTDLMLPQDELVEWLSSGVGHPSSSSPWYNVIEVVQGRTRGPAIRIEFLAKLLAIGSASPTDGRVPVLASPLYVAMAD